MQSFGGLHQFLEQALHVLLLEFPDLAVGVDLAVLLQYHHHRLHVEVGI